MDNQDQTKCIETKIEQSWHGLLPLFLFVILFIVTGIILNFLLPNIHSIQNPQAFYLIFSPIFTIIPIVIGFVIIKFKFNVKLNALLKGAGNHNILIMILIYLLSGMFANVMSTIGASSAIATLGFKIMPASLIVGAVFIIAAILSTSMGTSVGTIVAFGPIVFSLGKYSSLSPAFLAGALLSGAMFGDDLSMISDTAIASCQTQQVSAKSRFLFNLKLLILPSIIAIVLYFTLSPTNAQIKADQWIWWRAVITIIPFVVVIVCSLCEINVFAVLLLGVVVALVIGFSLNQIGDWNLNNSLTTNYSPNVIPAHFDMHNQFNPQGLRIDSGLDRFLVGMNSLKQGMLNMSEIIFLALLTGALSGLCNLTNGMEWLINKFMNIIRGPRSAKLAIAGITSLVDVGLANNTITIILVGEGVRKLGERHQLNKNQVATFVSVFPAVFQGLIPYGAQMLLIISLANQQLAIANQISFLNVWLYSWYLYLLLATALVVVFSNQISRFYALNWWQSFCQLFKREKS